MMYSTLQQLHETNLPQFISEKFPGPIYELRTIHLNNKHLIAAKWYEMSVAVYAKAGENVPSSYSSKGLKRLLFKFKLTYGIYNFKNTLS